MAGSSSGNSELDYHLAVLKTVHGVSGVHSFGKEGSGKQYGVFLFVRTHPEADRVPIRVACSSVVGTTKLDAALVAKQRVAAALGSAALEAAEERVRMEHATAAAAAAPPSAFERMAAAQHVAPAEEAAAAAEKLAAAARAELAALQEQLEAAANKVEAADARSKELEEAADDAREAAGFERKRQKAEEGDADAEPSYRRWSPAKWNELETKEQARRAVPIDESRTDCVPHGDATRSWHSHWRRVYGACQAGPTAQRANRHARQECSPFWLR